LLVGIGGLARGVWRGQRWRRQRQRQHHRHLRLSITDAPACGYDSVFVTIEKVRVHQSATAGDADGGWSKWCWPHRNASTC
jgi:hypothetical protein